MCLDGDEDTGDIWRRSSHGISVIGDRAYVLGGETIARAPIDSDFFCRDLPNLSEPWQRLNMARDGGATWPVPRVAHAQATLGDSIYIFGGRQVGSST